MEESKLTPEERVKDWKRRLRKTKVSYLEWSPRYFPDERKYKVRGQFTNDYGIKRGQWIWYRARDIEQTISEFEWDHRRDVVLRK